MANSLIYNPLLKRNFQELGDLSPVEAEISDLQQKKVTKFFSATDTLEDGEVAEYQGTDDAVNGLVNGYFYKVALYNFPTGSQYFKYLDGQPTINLNGYNFAPGDYYIIRQVDVINTSFFDYLLYYYGDHQYFRVGIGGSCNIGDKIFDNDNTVILTVTAKSENVVTLSNGVTFNEIPYNGGYFSALYDCITADGTIYSILLSNMGKMVVHYNINGNQFNLIDWFYVRWVFQYTSETPLNIRNFTRVDTQPRTPGVTVADGVLQISLPVEFAGNITVHGSEVVVTTEQIQSENDFIKLRYNNPLALAAGETSGISVNNYDGNDTDCILAVDKDGWARVGDSSGTLEKIATIEETPTDAQFVQYDAQNKQLKTAAIPEATTTTAGLMSAEDKQQFSYKNINNIDLNSLTTPGFYYTYGGPSGSSDAQTITNKPTSVNGGFCVKVELIKPIISDTSNVILQTYIHYNSQLFYKRVISDNFIGNWYQL